MGVFIRHFLLAAYFSAIPPWRNVDVSEGGQLTVLEDPAPMADTEYVLEEPLTTLISNSGDGIR